VGAGRPGSSGQWSEPPFDVFCEPDPEELPLDEPVVDEDPPPGVEPDVEPEVEPDVVVEEPVPATEVEPVFVVSVFAESAEPVGGWQTGDAASATMTLQASVDVPWVEVPLPLPDAGAFGSSFVAGASPPLGWTVVPPPGSFTGVRLVEPSGLRMLPSGVVIEPSGLTLFGGTTVNFDLNVPSVPQTSTWPALMTVAVPS
jgi:hypothetical protein